ncbi:MAG: hypothetical protein IKO99_12935, partial [Bacteroidales bacterium]|nr:hypothetical protein [Bacteroidales bacterium]
MYKLVSKKVAVRLFTVLSILFIIQTDAWGQVKVNGTTYNQSGETVELCGFGTGENGYFVEFTQPTGASGNKISISGSGLQMLYGNQYWNNGVWQSSGTFNNAASVWVKGSAGASGTLTYTTTANGSTYTYSVIIKNVQPSLTLTSVPTSGISCNGSKVQLDAN